MWYTEVYCNGKRMVIINNKLTKKELREKLAPRQYDQEYLEWILNGEKIKKPLFFRSWDQEEGTITTNLQGWTWFIHWGDKVTVYPDCTFKVNHNKFLEIIYNAKIMVYNLWWWVNHSHTY